MVWAFGLTGGRLVSGLLDGRTDGWTEQRIQQWLHRPPLSREGLSFHRPALEPSATSAAAERPRLDGKRPRHHQPSPDQPARPSVRPLGFASFPGHEKGPPPPGTSCVSEGPLPGGGASRPHGAPRAPFTCGLGFSHREPKGWSLRHLIVPCLTPNLSKSDLTTNSKCSPRD